MNFSENFIANLKSEGLTGYFTDNYCSKEYYEVENLPDSFNSFVVMPVNSLSMRTVKLPKTKLITPAYVLEKFNKTSTFKNLAKTTAKLVDTSVNVYATSYGIGIVAIYNPLKAIQCDKVVQYLTKNEVKYSTEFSDTGWVIRIKISKTKENIARLESI